MPLSNQHISQATRNLRFLEEFVKSHQHNDWAVTVTFYSAVHVVENAVFLFPGLNFKGQRIRLQHSDDLARVASKQGIPGPANYSTTSFSPHQARKLLVNENFSQISSEYNLLYRESRAARYCCYRFSDAQTDTLIKKTFQIILDWSNKEFKTSFALGI